MIQMGDGSAVERCVQHLNNAPMFNSKNRLQLSYSKQLFLSDVTNPFTLPDGTPSFKDFIGNKHNRFVNLTMSLKNRIQSPSRVSTERDRFPSDCLFGYPTDLTTAFSLQILHFFNTPPTITEETLLGLFEEKKIMQPSTVKIFPMKSKLTGVHLTSVSGHCCAFWQVFFPLQVREVLRDF